MAWPLTPDGQYYIFEGIVLIPVDPNSGVAQLMLRPKGGIGVGIPAIADGAPGATPTLHSTVLLTELAYNDASPASASLTPISPNVYQLTLALHAGAPGTSAANKLTTATDLTGTIAAKRTIRVNSAANGFEYTPEKVGDRYFPATISAVAAGNANATICSINVPAQLFDWRPEVSGYCVITGTSEDVQVDLIARLNNATSGSEVGRATSRAGQTPPPHVLAPGSPTNSNDTYDKVLAGQSATIHLRAERQSGTGTFTTSASTTRFRVKVEPVP